MIDSLSRYITQRLVNNNIIDFDDIDIYIYGFQLFFATLFKGIGLLIIGATLGYIKEILVFIATFSVLRVYAGGYHSPSYLKCFIITVIFTLISILGGELLTYLNHFYLTLGILIIATILILIYAPVDSENRPLTESEHKRYRKISIFIIMLQVLIIILLYNFKEQLILYCNIASISILIEALTLKNYKDVFRKASIESKV